MRPIRLTISGWGPYSNVEIIDFEQFEDGCMFLITGPTGSGKTTIFDAITYAIYGMVSGKTRDKNSVRSDFAKDETDTFVELIFTHKGKNVVVKRAPKYDRKKKRGEGVVTQNEIAELMIDDNTPVTVVKEVNQALVELMGFTYEQYKQIAMIAQGEFMELLLASSKERVEIFRNLFKTAAYDRIQKVLTEKAKRQYQEIMAIRQRMEEARSMIDADGDDILAELIENKYPSYVNLMEALAQNIKSNQGNIRELEKQRNEKENNLLKLKGKGQAYFDVAARFEKIAKELSTQEVKVQNAQKKYEDSVNKKETLEQQIKKEVEISNQNIDKLQKEKEDLQAKLVSYEPLDREEGILILSFEQAKNEKEAFLRLVGKQNAIKQQVEKLKNEQDAYIKEEKKLKELKKIYEEKEEKYKAATIGIVALLVEEGKPCPVCGSVEHPNIASLSKEVPDEKEVKLWKTKCESQVKVLEQIYQKATKEKGILEAMKRDLNESFASLSIVKDSFDEAYQAVLKKEKEVEEKRTALQIRKDEYKKLKDQAEKVKAALEDQKKRRENKRDDAEKLRLAIIDTVNQKKTEWESQKAVYRVLNTEKEKLSKAEADLRAKIDIETVKEEIASEEVRKKELQKEKDKKLSKLTINRNAMESIKQKLSVLTEKEEIHSVYSNLENVTKGNNKDRVVFEHYVLAAYFEDVLQAANVRLTSMTGGRYELMKVRKVADARTTDSLDLEVLDNYTGKARSVKTLSGGESFKAALSMALGLSDIVQNNAGGIQVETLFIDEGFGSLDEESLDQALESLMKLSGHNQMIGIISHVNELKERMEKQIVVEKEKNGSKILPFGISLS